MDVIFYLYLVNVILALAIIFFERRNPGDVLFWMLVLLLLPAIGFVLYLIFGRRPVRWNRRSVRFEKREMDYLAQLVASNDMGVWDRDIPSISDEVRDETDLALFLRNTGAVMTGGNSVTILTEGRDLYSRLFDDIQRARHHVHVEFFIIRDDETGNSFLKLLIEKAKEGVEVRLLVDDVGERPSQTLLTELKSQGGRYARFYPSHVPIIRWLNSNVNYRNHRKIVVVDGRIAYTGGFNVGDEYLGKDPKLGHWRDTHVRLEGEAALSLQLRFVLDWNQASDEAITPNSYYFPVVKAADGTAVQIVSSGPTERNDQIKEAYLKMITSARVSILIQSPYFVPDGSVMDMLRIAARSGVDVRIMIPRRKDQMFVHWVSQSFVGELLPSGVKAYYYENGFLHSKTITVDSKVTSIGSTNWDIRGFSLNFETNAVIYGEAVGREHERLFMADLGNCTELTKEAYDRRPMDERIKESLFRLLSPVL
jgi:cardiolipin synthase